MALFAAQNLSRTIEGRTLFENLNFGLEQGETLSVKAPSGSGKTLLLRLLAGLDPLESGQVSLDGKPQKDWTMTRWRSRVVYCAQRAPIFPGTPANLAAEVAGWSTHQGRDQDDVIALAREWEVADVWDKDWSKLSGGEAQRAALAIAVATRPDVLLLDEPTSALDQRAQEIVEERLASVTSIWVTHDPQQAKRVAEQSLNLADFAPEES